MAKDPPTLSAQERAVINQCRWIRDLPLPSLGWGTVRMELYAIVVLMIWIVVALTLGISPVGVIEFAGGWAVVMILALIVAWLATLFQRMAVLIDKLGRYVETQELILLSKQHESSPKPDERDE